MVRTFITGVAFVLFLSSCVFPGNRKEEDLDTLNAILKSRKYCLEFYVESHRGHSSDRVIERRRGWRIEVDNDRATRIERYGFQYDSDLDPELLHSNLVSYFNHRRYLPQLKNCDFFLYAGEIALPDGIYAPEEYVVELSTSKYNLKYRMERSEKSKNEKKASIIFWALRNDVLGELGRLFDANPVDPTKGYLQ